MSSPAGYSCLSFLTDYGREDGFVAVCHGQMLVHAPAARVVDITHEVPPGDVRRGATVLAETVPELPPGVHVAVVDPGVGTERRSVVVLAGGHALVGPDNGLLVWAAGALGGIDACYEIDNTSLWRHPVSATFHGRDIYAPVGARIAAGLEPSRAGTEFPASALVRLPEPRREVTGGTARGEVRAIDRFGNCQLTVLREDLVRAGGGSAEPAGSFRVRTPGGRWTVPFGTTFGSVGPGEPVVLVDSAGYIAVAENSGDAARRFGLSVGAAVDLEPVTRESRSDTVG
ncbi:SAM hydrolase/SAM-dependent halogenase family protein [Allosalinactinospora lopnorensis]|uniref:SAM hydrolase/SAM-dependent halogenase family protein n=1 Tax=Allosalinactinospora lopnorensis TaxID=1352348 RepID=UPI000623F137|nr:SAM-dependent chlorinase/fluorinase [Allosalinactinospora lopnorensis]